MHTSTQTDVYISVASNPIIEHCRSIRFAKYPRFLQLGGVDQPVRCFALTMQVAVAHCSLYRATSRCKISLTFDPPRRRTGPSFRRMRYHLRRNGRNPDMWTASRSIRSSRGYYHMYPSSVLSRHSNRLSVSLLAASTCLPRAHGYSIIVAGGLASCENKIWHVDTHCKLPFVR